MLLVHKAKNEINAHKNLVGLILDICERQTKFILNTSNLFQIKIMTMTMTNNLLVPIVITN